MINRIVWLTLLLFVLSNGAASSAMPAPPLVTIQSMPERPIIEVRDGNQFLNFDMVVGNASRLTSVYDSASQLALRRSVNTDAFAPSIAVIGKQILAPGETLDVFNPFSEFESYRWWHCSIPSAFCANRPNSNERKIVTACRMTLPLRGKIFVWEGHDLYAHHQRVPLGIPK